MATIVIKRKTNYTSYFRNYQIILDGKKIGTIKNGETKEFVTTSGQHHIQSKVDWYSSPELSLTLSEEDKKEIIIGDSEYGRLLLVVLGIILFGTNIINAFHLNPIYRLFSILPLIVLIVYYSTIGRKKYIAIKEG